jgi:hypothetical protein
MTHKPCTACGYAIQHDEECPGCAREEMDAQLAVLTLKLNALRTAAEHFEAWFSSVKECR